MDITKQKNLEILRRALSVKKLQHLMKLHELSDNFSFYIKNEEDLNYLFKGLATQDNSILSRFSRHPDLATNINSFLAHSHTFKEFKDAKDILDSSFDNRTHTFSIEKIQNFYDFLNYNHGKPFNGFIDYTLDNPPDTVLRNFKSIEARLVRKKEKEIDEYVSNNVLSARIQKEIFHIFKDENNFCRNLSDRKLNINLGHRTNQESSRFSVNHLMESPIIKRLIAGAIIVPLAALTISSAVNGITNASRYNSFTYETAISQGYTHSSMNLSGETSQKITDLQSKLDMYTNNEIPSQQELISLVHDVINLTNDVVGDKTTAAFEAANPGSKVSSVRHYFDDANKEAGNMLRIEYTDSDGHNKTIVMNNNFENSNPFEAMFRNDDINESYSNDRTLDGLSSKISDEYSRAGGDPYKEAPIAQRYITRIQGLLDSNLNMASKNFVYTYKDGFISSLLGNKHNLSSKVPDDYQEK